MKELPQRIVDNIDLSTPSACWEWVGYGSDGYGHAWYEGKKWTAHRLMWTVLVGEIPEGLQVDHLCRNRRCVNPDHLEPVTQQENIRRGMTGKLNHRNTAKTHCKRGHEFTPDNTYIRPNGARNCRACAAARSLKAYHART